MTDTPTPLPADVPYDWQRDLTHYRMAADWNESGERLRIHIATLTAEVERLRDFDGMECAAENERLHAEVERLTSTDDEIDGFYCLADGHQHRNRYAEALCSMRYRLDQSITEVERLKEPKDAYNRGIQHGRNMDYEEVRELSAEVERLRGENVDFRKSVYADLADILADVLVAEFRLAAAIALAEADDPEPNFGLDKEPPHETRLHFAWRHRQPLRAAVKEAGR